MSARRAAFVYALILAVEFLAMVSANGTPWRGEWNWTLDYAVGSTVLTGPLVGAFAAWVCADDRRRAVLIDGAPLGWLAPIRTAALATGVGLLAFLTALAGALLATATVPHGGPVSWWLPGVAVPVLALNAVLGAAIGHLWPQRVLVVLVAPALFLLSALPDFDLGPRLIRQGPTSGSLGGQTFDGSTIGLQAAAMGGAIAAVLAAQAVRRRVRRPLAAGVLVVSLIGTAVLSAAVPGGYDDRLRATDERATACAGERPRVCLLPSNRRSLEPVSRQLRRVAAPLIEAGAAVPDTYVNAGPIRHGPPDAGEVQLNAEANVASYSLLEAAQSIARPAPCADWSSTLGPPEDAFGAQGLIFSWILHRLGQGGHYQSEEAADWFRATAEEDQVRVAVRLFEDLRTCRLDQIELPWQPAS